MTAPFILNPRKSGPVRAVRAGLPGPAQPGGLAHGASSGPAARPSLAPACAAQPCSSGPEGWGWVDLEDTIWKRNPGRARTPGPNHPGQRPTGWGSLNQHHIM